MRLPVFVGLSASVLVPTLGAQTVTEQEFLSAFTEESSAVRALSDGVAGAEAARKRAGLLSNPRVDFWRERPDANPRVTNWTLSWTPPLDGRYGLGKKRADAGLGAARQRLAAAKASLRRDIRAAFAGWSLALERREALREQLDRVHKLAEVERARARVGEESGLSARRFTLAEAEVRSVLGTAEAALVRSQALARAWRGDLGPEAIPAPVAPPEPPAITEAAESPELRALDFEAEQARIEKRHAGRFLTFPTLQFGWQQLADPGVVRSGPILAAGWTVPLFDRDQATRREAERRQETAVARVALGRARVAAEVEGGTAAYRVLFAASREAARTTEDGARVIAGATAAFRAGEATLTDLLDSLRAAMAARLAEIDLRGQALEAHRELEAAVGRPLTEGGL